MAHHYELIWLLFASGMVAISMAQLPMGRHLCCGLFLAYQLLTGLRPTDFGVYQGQPSDTSNYAGHFQSIANGTFSDLIRSAWFEPGYSGLAYLVSIVSSNPSFFLLTVNLLTGVLFVGGFLRYKIESEFITFVFGTMSLIGGVASTRHFLCAALFFVLFCEYILRSKRAIFLLWIPVLFHYSFLAVLAVVMGDVIRRHLKLRLIFLFALMTPLALAMFEEFVQKRLLGHAWGRMQSSNQSLGLRNLVNILLPALFLTDFKNRRFLINRLEFLPLAFLLLNICLLLLPGLNRISGFISLALIVFSQQWINDSQGVFRQNLRILSVYNACIIVAASYYIDVGA